MPSIIPVRRNVLHRGAASAAGAAATTWNPSDKGTLVSLTNGNLTWRDTASNWAFVRSVATLISNQKVYLEMVVDNQAFAVDIGIADGTADLNAASAQAVVSPSHAAIIQGNGGFLCLDSVDNGSGPISAYATGDNIGAAFNSQTGKMWFRKNGGAWNNLFASQDPVTGTGGLSVPFSGPFFVVGGGGDTNDQSSVKFSSSSWSFSAPAGYTQLAA